LRRPSRSCSMAKVKFCGMTSLDDCLSAADLGVDFVGFVFYKKSRRAVSPAHVRDIVERLDSRVATVGVFIEESDSEIEEVVGCCHLDYAQVYRPTRLQKAIKAFRVGKTLPDTAGEGLILLDSDTAGLGGSGRSFDFSLLQACEALGRAFVAGGIDCDNVEDVLQLGPFGVDLVSSIEASPGRKDRAKMQRFMEKVRAFRI